MFANVCLARELGECEIGLHTRWLEVELESICFSDLDSDFSRDGNSDSFFIPVAVP